MEGPVQGGNGQYGPWSPPPSREKGAFAESGLADERHVRKPEKEREHVTDKLGG